MKEKTNTQLQDYHNINKDELISLRRSYGMSQIEWANFLGYTNKTYISLLENGEKKITKQMAFLCNLLIKEKQKKNV
jgi:DNA-binding transcriptional regulator YiaG